MAFASGETIDNDHGVFARLLAERYDRTTMQAIEKKSEVNAAAARWRAGFRRGSQVIGSYRGSEIAWHEHLRIWGLFGKTKGKGGIERDWNAFGQKPSAFRANMIVEMNQPPRGIDQNLQAVFALDDEGGRWLLHQGRMSVRPTNVTEADFIAATGLKPTRVDFSDGSRGDYHKVAPIDEPDHVIQEHMAAFIAQCAKARLAKKAPADPVIAALADVQDWERGLSPETTGSFKVAARGPVQGRRRHAEVWRALVADLTRRGVPHSNDRVGQYGPDLFTYGNGPKVLFEIKSSPSATDIFGGVGQLHIYERLLGGSYRKVLVVPEGVGGALRGPITALRIDLIEYRRVGRKLVLDKNALSECLAG
jgi:hypothetical protein